jgi:hypothetical protein
MSTINTNPINVNYPVPGVNNNSQGFRDNFASIVTNLNTAATELTDLQNKVVVKQALIGTTVNNDMANTLISNASTLGFRATTYNLGNSLAGTVLVNASIADVHYGTVSANTTINFGSWPPTGTQSNVQVRLNVSNANAVITFSANLIASNNTGATTLENFVSNGGLVTVTAPAGVSEMDYIISTTDCGNTLYIEPINRPRESTQIQQRLITPTGFQGDVNGTVAVGPSFNQLSVLSSNTGMSLSTVVISNTSGGFTCSATSLPLSVGQQLRISGTAGGTGSISGYSDPSTYYIIATNGSTTFQLSTTSGGSNITTTTGTPTGLTYKVNNGYLNVADTTQLYTDLPIVFTGTSFESNITSGTTYYVRNISANTYFTVSSTIGGANVNLAGGTGTMFANPVGYIYIATDTYNSTVYQKNVLSTTVTTNVVTLNTTSSLVVNSPIIFDANIGGLYANTVYYIKSISSPNITVSQSRTNGVADTVVTLSSNSTGTTANIYVGNDIWKRIPLTSW